MVTRGGGGRAADPLRQLVIRGLPIGAAVCLMVTGDARGDSLRCERDLVRPGDSYLAVTDACGEPDREVALMGEDDQRVGTALYYRGEYGQADRKVYLRGGAVTGIERLD